MISFENFSFANPNAGLILLLLIPLYYWLGRQDRNFLRLIDSTLSPLIKKLRFSDKSKTNTELPILMLGILFIIVAMMRPRWGYEMVETNYQGVDIAIAVDVSDSMLAEDLNPNRLAVAKRKIKDVIKETPQDRVALISSAGTAFIESPLTLDKTSIELLSSTLQPDLVPLKGSSLSSAIEAANKVFSKTYSFSNTSRAFAMILLTDGEYDMNDLNLSRNLLKQYEITPYAIIFGTPEGAPIPTGRGFKKDSSGKMVITKANLDNLKTVFDEFNGKVVMSDPGLIDVVEIVNKGIEKDLKKGKISYQNNRNWREYFQYPLIVGLMFILFTWRKPLKISLKIVLFFLIIFRGYTAYAEPLQIIKDAKKEYEVGHFNKALEILEQLKQTEENQSSTLLKGNVLYRLSEFSLAEKEFAKSASLSGTPLEKAQSLYNRGNALLQVGKINEAIADYELALRDSPTDKEIENNLEYAKRLLEEPPTQPDEEKKEEEMKKDKEQKQEQEKEKKVEEQKQDQKQPEQKKQEPEQSQQKKQDQENQKQEQEQKYENKDAEKPQNTSHDKNSSPENKNDSKDSKNETPKSNDNSKSEDKAKPKKETQSPHNNETKEEDGNNQTAKGPESKADSSGSGTDQNPPAQDLQDQILSQLNSIEEDTTSRQKYRYQKGLEELDADKIRKDIPRTDW